MKRNILRKIRGTETILKQWPKTREGLVSLIIEQLSKAETTYVSFCKEMDSVQNKRFQKELNYFCNNQCAIHKKHVSHQLFCLPLHVWS